MVHARVSLNYTEDPSPRGSTQAFSTNLAMARLGRPLGAGRLEVHVMATTEPWMGPRGYPLLLQTGETADRLNPLFDRQHPHDLIMEAAAFYRVALDQHTELFLYGAPVGEPALGPTAFMHRASAGDNPVAPIAHHFLDGTHITYGVVTAGIVNNGALKIEGSLFNGREPDPDHWAPDRLRLDSYAMRVTLAPRPNWVFQTSVGEQMSPEQVHPGINYVKLTASATYNRPLAHGNLQITAAVGRNRRQETVIPVPVARRTFSPTVLQYYLNQADTLGIPVDSLSLYFPERIQTATMLEWALRLRGHSVFGRLEYAQKDELFLPSDLRHGNVFDVGKLNMGYAYDIPVGPLRLGVGATGSIGAIPPSLQSVYGRWPVSGLVFTRVEIK
jgi:hypothetical protein